jgi:hypothetical protein
MAAGGPPLREGWLIEEVGAFRLYHHTAGGGYQLAWSGAWLPGVYACRDAALFACGYVLGGEAKGYLDALWARADGEGREITIADMMG